MIEGQYKFLKVKDSLCHFASVSVKIDPEGPKTVYTFSEEWPEWVRAAVEGASEICKDLKFQGSVEISEVKGTICDTTAEDVRLAAKFAVWKTIKGEPLPELAFSNGTWIPLWHQIIGM